MTRMQVFWAVLWVVGCGGQEGSIASGDPAVFAEADIIGGAVDPQDLAVVALVGVVRGRVSPFCTGALVGPRLVLTAAHCIEALGRAVDYWAVFGPAVDAPRATRRLVHPRRHPDWDPARMRFDHGLWELERPVGGVRPMPVRRLPLIGLQRGAPLRHVGFGRTRAASNSGVGVKRSLVLPLAAFDAWHLWSGAPGAQTCNGDSGGPALMRGVLGEEIVGVVSFGDVACARFGADGRVDVARPWLEDFL